MTDDTKKYARNVLGGMHDIHTVLEGVEFVTLTWGNWQQLLNLSIHLPCGSATALLLIHPRAINVHAHRRHTQECPRQLYL